MRITRQVACGMLLNCMSTAIPRSVRYFCDTTGMPERKIRKLLALMEREGIIVPNTSSWYGENRKRWVINHKITVNNLMEFGLLIYAYNDVTTTSRLGLQTIACPRRPPGDPCNSQKSPRGS